MEWFWWFWCWKCCQQWNWGTANQGFAGGNGSCSYLVDGGGGAGAVGNANGTVNGGWWKWFSFFNNRFFN
jgi:hypothetical protein